MLLPFFFFFSWSLALSLFYEVRCRVALGSTRLTLSAHAPSRAPCPYDGPACCCGRQDRRSSPTLPEKTGVLSLLTRSFFNRYRGAITIQLNVNGNPRCSLPKIYDIWTARSTCFSKSINVLFIYLFIYFLTTADSSSSIYYFHILVCKSLFGSNKCKQVHIVHRTVSEDERTGKEGRPGRAWRAGRAGLAGRDNKR